MALNADWLAGAVMMDEPTQARVDLARELQELIAALDRRVPRVGQAGEREIARDAAALRARAVARLIAVNHESGGW